MNITSINFNAFDYKSYLIKRREDKSCYMSNPSIMKPALVSDIVTFAGVCNGGDVLKKLSAYGVPDMYTGLILLDPKIIEKMQNNNFFNEPLHKIVKVISQYKNTMMPINREVFNLIKQVSLKHPDIQLSDAMKELYPLHKHKLLHEQQGIFEEIIRLACDLPKELYAEFSELMNITNKRLLNDPVVLPFSEKEFLYKLRRIGNEMLIKNNYKELRAMRRLISSANKIFHYESKGSNKYGRNIKKKLEIQMQPEVLKRNSSNLAEFKKIFAASPLKNNTDIIKLLDITSAKVHGFPSYANFERKSFIHELNKITRKLKNKEFAQEFSKVAQHLPTSKDSISAFIVKSSDQSNSKIGSNILYSGMCSIDHLVAKKNGGANHLSNYGLCGQAINNQKTNIFFEDWVKLHPETSKNCQKYVDRLIELYKLGVFETVSKKHKYKKIDMTYIENFAKTIYNISPAQNRINLDISKLYK